MCVCWTGLSCRRPASLQRLAIPVGPPCWPHPGKRGEIFFGGHTHDQHPAMQINVCNVLFFSPLEIQKASFFSCLFLKNPISKLLIRHESVISGDPRPLVGSHLARPLRFERHRRVDVHTWNPKEWNLKSSYGRLCLFFFTILCICTNHNTALELDLFIALNSEGTKAALSLVWGGQVRGSWVNEGL